VTAGDPTRRTGGNLYDEHMVRALHRAGTRVTTIALRDRRDATRLRELGASVVLVDTIAAPLAAPHLARVRANGAEVVALAHMRNGALTLARRADRVIVVSRSLAESLVAGGIDRRRIAVIPPGRERLAARPGVRRGPVLCVANWTPAKGIHTLLSAVARAPRIRVELVGDAPNAAYAARVRRLIRSRGLASRVRTYGSLGRAALDRRYAAASIFALASVREGYPIVLVEALSHGLPIVACDIPGVREVTRDAAVLVAPGRALPFASALGRLASNEDERRALQRRARDRARRLPTWADSESRFVREMRSLLARR
jgi:glycosyltransferase involved in cell wall biosynthesis